jgi:Uma2 family endonuclease
MGVLPQPQPQFPSVASFRAWLESRPEKERWELIEGVAMMMAPPNRQHQRIMMNLANLLNAALAAHDPTLEAIPDTGVNVTSDVPYDPEPDVVVIREVESPDPRYARKFYLAAEVLSDSDRGVVDRKRRIYREQAACRCILLVRQDAAEIVIDERTADGWGTRIVRADDELALPDFGLRCPVRDVYRRTPLG